MAAYVIAFIALSVFSPVPSLSQPLLFRDREKKRRLGTGSALMVGLPDLVIYNVKSTTDTIKHQALTWLSSSFYVVICLGVQYADKDLKWKVHLEI